MIHTHARAHARYENSDGKNARLYKQKKELQIKLQLPKQNLLAFYKILAYIAHSINNKPTNTRKLVIKLVASFMFAALKTD